MHCRLQKCGVLWVCLIQCFSTSVQQYIQNVPINAVSEGESLDSPLDKLFGHIQLVNELSPEIKHRFIYCQISPWNVVIHVLWKKIPVGGLYTWLFYVIVLPCFFTFCCSAIPTSCYIFNVSYYLYLNGVSTQSSRVHWVQQQADHA